MLGLILDAVVACLLVATIWYAIQLSGRLRILRADGERMERLIAGLSAASHQAEEAVGDLKDTAGHAGRQLQAAIDKAQELLADLQFMVDRAESAADRLDESLRAQRTAATPAKPVRRDSENRSVDASSAAASPPEARHKRVETATARATIELDQTDKEIHNRLASLLKQAEASTRAVRATPPAADPTGELARPIALQSRAEREFMKALEARK
jgi:ABC-type transporter Mla subunit MlaD